MNKTASRALLAGLVLFVARVPVAASRVGQSVAAETLGLVPAWRAPLLQPFSPVEARDVRPSRPERSTLVQGEAGAPLSAPSSASPEAIALAFLRQLRRPAGELAVLSVVEGGGAVRFVTVEQRFASVPVLMGRATIAIGPDGRVLAARVGEFATAAPPPMSAGRISGPGTAIAAARAAFDRAAVTEDALPAGPLAALPPERVVIPLQSGSVHGWRVRLAPGGRPEHFAAIVLAEADGRPLMVSPLVLPGVAAARVFPRDPLQGSQWVTFPDPVLRPSIHSPMGWTYALETIGNNAWVELDRESNSVTTPTRSAVAAGDPAVLDFPYTGDPRADVDVALTNVFWAINDAHDRFRALGFDEPSGNCQDHNLQRGGADTDRVYGLVQWDAVDGSVPANFVALGTAEDGGFTYLLTTIFQDEGGQLRDSALETDLLYHELAHSASIRLMGGDAACFDGVQPGAVTEGWSDFLAASFTDDPVIGAFTSGRPGRGQREFPVGGGGLAFINLCDGYCDRFRDGEIWSGTLWDMRALLMMALGREEGIRRAERLVVESMRYTPCRPTFVDARDALLLADTAVFAGADRCTLWQAFAGRGVGHSTITAGPDDMVPVGGFDMPPECGTGVDLSFDASEYSPDADGVVTVIDTRAAVPASVDLAASGGDRETVALSAVPGGPVLNAAFRLVPGVPVPGDGILQAASGEVLSASYGAATARARISGALPVRVLEHHVWGTWCQLDADDDYSDAWYPLPGFLDAGENADMEVVLGHDVPVDLQDVEVRVTSLSPSVRVLPAGPIALGSIGARNGTTSRRFEIRFRAEALPTVTAGEIASIRIDVTSRGRSGSVTLDLELNMDYEVVPSMSVFDGGVETFDPGSSTAGTWYSEASRGTVDLWRAEDCAGNGGTRGWRNGLPGCLDYVEGQEASTLLSPPVFPVLTNMVAYKLRAFEWDNDAMMYSYPNTFCDADFVGLFITDDPATLPLDDPEAIYSDASRQRYWRPIFETTGGWVTQRPFNYSTQPRLMDPSLAWDRLQLAWVFWGDIYDCGVPLPNSGHYNLDNVRLEFDLVRKVPEATPCVADCLVSAPIEIVPPGPKCPGEPFTIRARSEIANCAGELYFSFAGPGVPGSHGWTTLTEAPAIGEDGANYAVYAQCETSPECNDYDAWTNDSPATPSLGGPWPDSLRARREGYDVVLSWVGASAPPAYAVLAARNRVELAATPATWPRAGLVDGEGLRGEGQWRGVGLAGEPGIAYLLVFGRDVCTDVPRVP